MGQCRLCKFDVERDDEVIHFPSGHCLCLRCFHREVDDEKPMPLEVRRSTEAAVKDAEQK